MPQELPPLHDLAKTVGYGVILPALITALVLLALGWVRQMPGRIIGGIAFLAGFLTGWVVLCKTAFDKPLFRFTDEWHWLPVWAAAAVFVDLADIFFPKRRVIGQALRVVAVLATAFAAAHFLVSASPARTPGDMPPNEARPHLLHAFTIVVSVIWLVVPLAAIRALPALLLAISALAAGMILQQSGIGIYAQLAGLLGGVLLGSVPLAWWKPESDFVRAMIPGVAMILPALMFNGYLDSWMQIPIASFALTALAPLALLLGSVPALRRLSNFWRLAIPALGVILPLGVAVALAMKSQ